MGLLDKLLGKSRRNKPGRALTPREIEELHQRLQEPLKQTEPKVPFVPSQRTRSLTMAPQDGDSGSNEVLSQSQATICCLPAGVRRQILKHCVGGRKHYLTVKHGALVRQEKFDLPDAQWWPRDGLLSLVFTCRMLYSECIDLLYSENTFGFGFGSTGYKKCVPYLDAHLLPARINSIRSIEVCFHLVRGYTPYDDSHPQAWDNSINVCPPDRGGTGPDSWEGVWTALAGMRQLKSLVVVVYASGEHRDELSGTEERLLSAAAQIRHIPRFVIVLPWEKNREHKASQNLPFVVTRKYHNMKRNELYIPRWDTS